MSLSLSGVGNSVNCGADTSPARVPLDPLFASEIRLIRVRTGRRGRRPRTRGSAPLLCAESRQRIDANGPHSGRYCGDSARDQQSRASRQIASGIETRHTE